MKMLQALGIVFQAGNLMAKVERLKNLPPSSLIAHPYSFYRR